MAGEGRLVAILGVGTIGESLLRGLLSGGWREPSEVVVTVRDEQRAAELGERYGVEATTSNAEAVAGAALVVIAVKPQDFDALLGEIGGLLTPEQTVLSVAAAIPTAAIESRIGAGDRKSTRLNSSHQIISYAVFCLKKKKEKHKKEDKHRM